jgi:hypothetical protein
LKSRQSTSSPSTAKLPAMDTMRVRLPGAKASGEDVCAAVGMKERVGDHATSMAARSWGWSPIVAWPAVVRYRPARQARIQLCDYQLILTKESGQVPDGPPPLAGSSYIGSSLRGSGIRFMWRNTLQLQPVVCSWCSTAPRLPRSRARAAQPTGTLSMCTWHVAKRVTRVRWHTAVCIPSYTPAPVCPYACSPMDALPCIIHIGEKESS